MTNETILSVAFNDALTVALAMVVMLIIVLVFYGLTR